MVAIKAFRHKGLERFFATGSQRGIQAKQADRLRLILGSLNAAATPRAPRQVHGARVPDGGEAADAVIWEPLH